MSTPDIVIPERAGYYLRAMVHRGLTDTLESSLRLVRSLEKYDDSEVAGTIRDSVEGMAYYNLQLLRETLEQFEHCPPEAVGDEWSFRSTREGVEELAQLLTEMRAG